jgi:formate dehydrogenase subunit delta
VDTGHLVTMANDIAAFFASDPDPAAAADQVANHLKKFWEPRMRAEILRHVSQGGTGLSSIALQAVKKLS